MKKLIFLLLAGLTAALLLCGCGREAYSKDEVKEYIENNLGVKSYKIIKENEKYEDEAVWTVKLKDGSNLEFRVVDNATQDLFGTNHYLSSDYYDVMADYESEKYTDFDFIEKQITEYDDGTISTVFCGVYENREEFDKVIAEGRKIAEFIQSSDHPCLLSFQLQFNHPLREYDSVGYGFGDDADINAYSAETITDETEKKALNNMIIMCKDMNYEECLADFSESEIKEAIAASTSCIGLCYGRVDRDSYVYYDDICGSIYSQNISYPTMYTLLKSEGIHVSGNQNAYSFTGRDGSEYQVYYNYNYPDEIKCLKDGQEMEVSNLFAHFSKPETRAILGVTDVMVWKLDYQPNADVYVKDGKLRVIENITLDGKEMTYTEVEDGYFKNITDDYKRIYYDEDRGTYMINMDIGWTTDNQSCPYICHEWVKALGGTYTQVEANFLEKMTEKKDIYKTKWVIGNTTYTTKSVFGSGEIKSYEIKKNGKAYNLNYLTREDSTSVGATFLIAVTIDEFADLFDLEYDIDQENEVVNFYTK